MSGAHTAGPWTIRYHAKTVASAPDRPRNILDGSGRIIVTWVDSAGLSWQAGDEKHANARLISAAPDLLEALISARNTMSGCGLPKLAVAICDAAIAKAKASPISGGEGL